MYYVILALSMR